MNKYRFKGDTVKHYYKVSFVKKLPYFENGRENHYLCFEMAKEHGILIE